MLGSSTADAYSGAEESPVPYSTKTAGLKQRERFATLGEIPCACLAKEEMATSSCDQSLAGNSSVYDTDVPKEHKEVIAQKESKVVGRLKILLLLTLLASALTISIILYYYAHGKEVKEFKDHFDSAAKKLIESIGETLFNTLGATDGFVVKIITYADESNSSFPLVTLPHFALHATKVLQLSKAIHLSVKHIVYKHEREEWEKYVAEHDDWIQYSLDIQEQLDDWRAPIIRDFNATHNITDGYGNVMGDPTSFYEESYLPQWTQAPVMTDPKFTTPYGLDVFSLPPNNARANELTIRSKKITFGEKFWGIPDDPNDPVEQYFQWWAAEWGAVHLPAEEVGRSGEPSVQLNFPMLNSVDSVAVHIADPDAQVVGVATFTYYFRHFLENLLASNVVGVRVVLRNECGPQVFTYQVDGAETTYLGDRDIHDAKYDHHFQFAVLDELINNGVNGTSSNSKDYSGPRVAEDYCRKTIFVFPSTTMEEKFITNDPLIFSVGSALIFLLTSAVFLSYDHYVKRRQGIVLGRAQASGAIVDSLFPAKVRDQLYEEQRHGDAFNQDSEEDVGEPLQKPRAIAELYEETTIFFMDLAGFTAWSARRTPVDVFELLETVYSEFDAIAVRRAVFKVETIGDSYVAVTGIPEPQEHHALIMVKFARDVMVKFSQIREKLAPQMGEDTKDLEMRVGLHSGPTIGGVIRGEKGRFQLFGDSVNTASRMESTGVKGKIQCSQATADCLIAAGKSSWLKPREDKIVAKGKGEMDTYFVYSAQSEDRDVKNLNLSEWGGSAPELCEM